METRRNVSKSSAAVSAFAVGGLSGQMVKCGPTGIVVDPAVIQQVQQAVAAACNWIPAGLTIAGLVATSFPVAGGVATITAAVLNEISAALCAAKPVPVSATPGKFEAKTILNTQLTANGWVVDSNKLVYV